MSAPTNNNTKRVRVLYRKNDDGSMELLPNKILSSVRTPSSITRRYFTCDNNIEDYVKWTVNARNAGLEGLVHVEDNVMYLSLKVASRIKGSASTNLTSSLQLQAVFKQPSTNFTYSDEKNI